MSIVTYGQCGMGKTYTMYANRFDDEFFKDDYTSGDEPGIVVRAIDDIFMYLMKRPAGCRFGIKVGWLDLCGDEIVDLLDGVVQCYSIDDVFQCLRNGSVKVRNRRQHSSVAAHNIFTIAIEQQWVVDGFLQHRLSTASFCDLAGTERQPMAAEVLNEFMENGSAYGDSVPKDASLQALERIVSTLCASSTSASPMHNEQFNLLNQYENTMLTKFLKDSFGGRAQTLMIFCVSPLACDAIETIQNLQFAYRAQFVRNKVIMNAFSDNNKPIANYWEAYETPDINLLSKAIQFNGGAMYEKPMMDHCKMNGGVGGNCGSGQNAAATAATLAGLKFANSQWLKLVANAETLFNKLLVNNTKTLNEQDRECIEQWMFLKRECDDCFGTITPSTIPSSVPHTLGPIPEKSEPGENGCSDDANEDDCNGNSSNIVNGDVAIAMQKVLETDSQFTALNDAELDNESDMDQFEFLPERITELMQSFSCKMNEIVDQNYADFVQNYPKGVMQSVSDDEHKQQQPTKPPSSPADNATANMQYVKTKRSNSVTLSTEPIATYPTGRRRSIHAAAAANDTTVAVISKTSDADCPSSAIPNTAQLARLNRLADECIQNSQTTTSSTNTVCREINDFLDNSDEMHPLRMANRNRETYETAICRLQSEIEAKEKQQYDLLHSIKERTQLMKQCQPGKQSLKQREEHLLQQKEKCEKTMSKTREKKKIEKLRTDLIQIQKDLNEVYKIKQANRDTDTTIRECEQHIEKSKRQLASLKKDLKNQKKTLEKLQAEFIKSSKGDKKSSIYGNNHNIDAHINQLDCVLKEKRTYLQQQTSGESQFVDSLRHEIRNLRSQRERLNEQQWACYQKLNGGNQLSDRQFLQYDVAKEVIDYAIEYKNQLISNKKTIFIESPDLMNQLKRLSEKEMRIVLYKCLQKIVDLRKSTGFVENELIRLEKELDKSQLRERAQSQQFQQFRLKTNGYTLSLENQYDKLLRVYLQGAAAGMPMRNENAAAPLLMSPSHILRSKHHQHYRHQQQRATINQIEYNVHDNDDGDGDENHRRNASQRHPYRLVNPTSALVTASPSIESASAAATTTTTTAFDSFQKQKPQKFHSLMKLLKQSPLMLTNHSHSPANAEHSGKVTVDKNNKKIFIQQNKTH